MANNNLEIILSLKDELTSGLRKASKDLDTFATNMKNVGRDISQVGGTIALFGGTISGPFVLALKNASKGSIEVKNSLERLNTVTNNFQKDMAQAVIPIVQKFTNVLVTLYDRFLQIPEPIRTSILQTTLLAGVFLTLGGGVTVLTGKIIGLISNVASLTSAFIAFSVANPVLLGVVATVGILIALMFKFKSVADFVLNSFEVFFNTLKAGFLTVKAVNEEFIASIAIGLSKVIAGYASLGLAGSETMTNMANDLAMVAGDFKVFATRDIANANKALTETKKILTSGEGDFSKGFDGFKQSLQDFKGIFDGLNVGTNEFKLNFENAMNSVQEKATQALSQLKQLTFEVSNSNILEAERQTNEQMRLLNFYKENYMQAHAGMAAFTVTVGEAIKSNLSNAITGIITGAHTAKEAFSNLGKAMIQAIVSFMAQKLIASALEKTLLAATVAAAVPAAAVIAAAWAPAALFANIASFGGAGAAAAASFGVASAAAISAGAASSLGGVPKLHSGGIIKAHNGLAVDEVPIIAQTGEGVLSRRGMQALGGNNALNSLNRGVGIQGNTSINIYINNANMNSEKGISDTAEMLGFEIERNLRLARGI